MRACMVLVTVCMAFPIAAAVAGDKVSNVNVTNPVLPVRSVDEPARVPYAYDLAPTCSFQNSCSVDFPAVPAGKRLRLTEVRLMFVGTNIASVFIVRTADAIFPTVAFPVAPFSGAYLGNLLSGSFDVDLIYEAGQQPALELGNFGGIVSNSANRFGVTGYLVDVAP
jgi:hypothetical protein